MLSKRNEKIDVLKGACIIFVIITHFRWSADHRLKFLFPFWIDQAVPIFMILSGYLLAKTFLNRKMLYLKDAYSSEYISERMTRFLLPFIIIFFVEIIFEFKGSTLYELRDGNIFNRILGLFIVGGVGPGAYYIPVMIQLIFVYPFIYFWVKESDYHAVISIFIICFAWEYIKYVYKMSDYEYRLLIVRYLPAISVGCYLAIGKTVLNKPAAMIAFCLGLTWLITDQYYCHIPFFFNKDWAGTSCLDVLYIAPLISCYLKNEKRVLKLHNLSKLGKASYQIFLFQKLFYTFLYEYIDKLANDKLYRLILYLIICLSGGTILYQMESKVSNIVVRHIKKGVKKIGDRLFVLLGKLVENR